MNDKKDLRRLFQEHFPGASREEVEERAAAQRRTLEQLRNEVRELQTELEARTANPEPPPWPGAVEPLVLAAAFVLRGDGDVDSIAEKVLELSSRPHRLGNIRFTVHRLVRRGLLSEHDRCFTITPQGERELAQARDDAKRWINALGDWPGPSTANS
jgi:hypothetical protein